MDFFFTYMVSVAETPGWIADVDDFLFQRCMTDWLGLSQQLTIVLCLRYNPHVYLGWYSQVPPPFYAPSILRTSNLRICMDTPFLRV